MRKGFKYIVLLLSVMAISCTKEDMEDCFAGVNLKFRFTLHEEAGRENLFGRNVNHVKVYIFDGDSILQHIKTEKGSILTNDYIMPIDLQPGRYTIVAWASDNENFLHTHNQLHAVDMSQNPPLYKELVIGESRMEDLRILLETEPATEYPEALTPKTVNFDDLYFGAVGTRSSDGKSKYTIVPVEIGLMGYVEREIELIRNTSVVRVTIEGLENLAQGVVVPESLLNIWMTGANTQYQYDNTLEQHALSTRYLPQYTLPAPGTAQADVKIERLEWTKQSGERMKLHVKLRNGKTLYSGELLSLLQEAKDETGSYIYKNQEDLDRIYTHPIRFVIARDPDSQDLYLKIYIHNWELITLIPEL